MQPKSDLKAAAQEAGLTDEDFRTLFHGQSLCFQREPNEELFVE